jgi:homoserine O-succinyltransferase
VTYWDELCEVMDWTQTNVQSTFGVCWGGMAMIHHFHGVRKHMLDHKAFGCFRHTNLAPSSPYLRGFSDEFVIPVSRWTEMKQAEIDAAPKLRTLLGSDEVGPCLVEDPDHRALYIFNHFEYDSGTLKEEYDRDIANGTPINVPMNYYPDDDPSRQPLNRWRSHAHLLYGNWVNEIYQTTPKNMGFIFAFWDWAAGTLYAPKGKEEITYGLGTDEDGGKWHSLRALYFLPFRQSLERLRSRRKSSEGQPHRPAE